MVEVLFNVLDGLFQGARGFGIVGMGGLLLFVLGVGIAIGMNITYSLMKRKMDGALNDVAKRVQLAGFVVPNANSSQEEKKKE